MPLSDLGDVAALIRRFKKAQKNYEQWRSLHQDAFDFVMPQRETFTEHAPGQPKNRHVFDSTAIEAVEQFASRIKGSNMPSWKKWALLTSGTIVPEDEREEFNAKLDQLTERFFNNINHSNFDTEINPALADMGVGTGAIIIDQGRFNSGDTFVFSNVPLPELYPEKPAMGRIRSAWRKQKMEIGKIKVVWPAAELPDRLQQKVNRDPMAEEVILNGQLFNPNDGRYYHVVIHEGSKSLLFTQNFATQRFIVFRWHVVSGEVYGRGPAIQTLPDIRTLNKIVQFKLEALALAVGGVYTGINDGIFNPNTVRIAPKTIIPVGSNNAQNPTLAPLALGGDPTSVELTIRDLQDRINQAFFANPLGDISDPVRTATENMIRQQEMLKQAGASFGRLRSELISPLIDAGLDIMGELGQIPQGLSVNGQSITIKHASPLAKAEDLEEFQAMQTWANTNLAIVGPEVFQGTARVEDFPKVTADQLGVTAKMLRTPEEIAAIGAAAAQAAEAQLAAGEPQDAAAG